MKRALLATLLLLVACQTASAQQDDGPVAWQSPLGRIAYTSESGNSGVLEYPVPFGDNVGYLYVQGLAGEFGGAGPLTGYWSEPDVSHDADDDADNPIICPFAIVDDHGRTTRNWGRLTIAFTDDWFPTDFILMRGRCFEDPHDVIPGKLVK